MIYKDHLGRAEIWVTRKIRTPFPLVRLKTYNRLLSEYSGKEHHYWKQFVLRRRINDGQNP